MKGYWNHPEETKEAFFGEWFRTGDLGTENDDGYFCIVDRKKDMTIVNSMNVYRRMVEEILYQHPAVREAAVVGEPDELHGEIPSPSSHLRRARRRPRQEVRQHYRHTSAGTEVPAQGPSDSAAAENEVRGDMTSQLRH